MFPLEPKNEDTSWLRILDRLLLTASTQRNLDVLDTFTDVKPAVCTLTETLLRAARHYYSQKTIKDRFPSILKRIAFALTCNSI